MKVVHILTPSLLGKGGNGDSMGLRWSPFNDGRKWKTMGWRLVSLALFE